MARGALAILLLASACESETLFYPWHIVRLPDGTNGAAVNCRGGMGLCYERAGQACNNGYEILDKEGHVSVVGAGYANRYGARWQSGGVYNGTMLIKCK